MQQSETVQPEKKNGAMTRLRDYLLLIKFSLTTMVVFSAVISYLLAPKIVAYDWAMIAVLFLAGMLVTGSANTINQVVEKDTDALMKRTAGRPIAAGRMSVTEGWAFALISGALGVFLLWYYFNGLSAGLAAFSLFLYAFVYTPLKKVNSISVLVGAFPGGLPCLIGFAAGNDTIFVGEHGLQDLGGWALFAIQFFWQFPHFWAIAWIAHKDYEAAGFKMLPSEKGPTKYSAIQSIVYSVLLIPVGLAPYFIGLTGWVSLLILLVCNLGMVGLSIRLYTKMEKSAARGVMFGSYIYLMIVFFALVADKV
ncbi:heme o synthase [Flavihumibacter sp. CACIAM 22H1]|uniref:heme o synthase n=1 Tax=Flavihumibacter sp. CACIAM 22H1 TaxID=1812911 RepID=UPI0007A8683B|nr:heme o synthase [Flavihumibacter sp. CACIAM 22H1]KYP13095.1 MAG: protoheme IX farnesyltransferase [Flavihumibacter sp. CACIAM 22H1]